MLQFICYFFPAFISAQIDREITPKAPKNVSDERTNLIANYGLYTILNNLVVMVVATANGFGWYSGLSFDANIEQSLHFLGVALISAVILPFVIKFLRLNFSVDIEVLDSRKTARRKKREKRKQKREERKKQRAEKKAEREAEKEVKVADAEPADEEQPEEI